ncbi:MAG: YceI family protein [Bacteroidota bacterium]
MKTLIKLSLLFFAFGLMMTACSNNNNSSEAAETGDAVGDAATVPATATNYAINTAESVINWTGSKPTGSTHIGTIKLSDGQLSMNGDELAGGSFTIDMNSLANQDLPEDQRGDLEGHLKTEDFLDVANHPKGTFVLTSASKVADKPNITHNIKGDLTLRGVTKNVSFDANVAVINNTIRAVTPSFTINRTEWGINYNSGILGTVKDKLIDDDIALVISLSGSTAN